MKKYIVHFIIWGLGIISYYILDKTTTGDEFQNISVLLIGCLMFYAVYYISMISEIKKIECELNESGIFGGRGMGILINMFSLQYIFELYKKPTSGNVKAGVFFSAALSAFPVSSNSYCRETACPCGSDRPADGAAAGGHPYRRRGPCGYGGVHHARVPGGR